MGTETVMGSECVNRPLMQTLTSMQTQMLRVNKPLLFCILDWFNMTWHIIINSFNSSTISSFGFGAFLVLDFWWQFGSSPTCSWCSAGATPAELLALTYLLSSWCRVQSGTYLLSSLWWILSWYRVQSGTSAWPGSSSTRSSRYLGYRKHSQNLC